MPLTDVLTDGILDQLGNPAARENIVAIIGRSFKSFHRNDELFGRTGKSAMLTSARQLAETLAALEHQLEATITVLGDLENQLAAAPGVLVHYGFTPWPRHDRLTQADVAAVFEDTYPTLLPWYEARLRYERYISDAATERLPPGPELDRGQQHCARLAYRLMQRFSNRKITGYMEGPFIQIATLLYEALTGRAEVDLQRHCARVLDNPPPIDPAPRVPGQ